MWGDARIMTEGWHPETDARLGAMTVITQGPKAESNNWKTKQLPLGAVLAQMCRHNEGQKDGPGFVGGEVIGDRRKAVAMKQLTFVGLDIDTGMKPEDIDAILTKLGCIAVRYTTHSNYKTETEFLKSKVVKFAQDRGLDPENIGEDAMRDFMSEVGKFEPYLIDSVDGVDEDQTEKGFILRAGHAPIPKNRVVIPFLEPFVMAKEANVQKDAIEKWKKIPTALARELGVPIDSTGIDPSRLFYYPRHKKGRPFECVIFGGDLFDWRSLELDDPFLAVAADMEKGNGKSKSKSKTAEGQALGKWSIARAQGFQIAEVIRTYAEDRIRAEVPAGMETECPFDEDHSNAGDPEDRACLAVNAGDGQSEVFTISCRHESCQGRTNLDMLGKMLKDGWFEEAVIHDEDFNALAPEETSQPEVAKRIVEEQKAKTGLPDMIAGLRRGDVDQITSIADALAKAQLSPAELDTYLAEIQRKAGVGKRAMRAQVQDHRRANEPVSLARGDKGALSRLEAILGRSFVWPPERLGRFGMCEQDGRLWLTKRTEDGPEPLCTPFELAGAATYVDRGGYRVLRINLLTADDEMQLVEFDAGELAGRSASEVIRQLLRAGMAFSPRGAAFVAEYLMSSQPTGPRVCHRPGWRAQGTFLCPTGEVIPPEAAKGLEMAPDAILKGAHIGGTYDAWRSAAHALYSANCGETYFDVLHVGPLLGWVGPLVDLVDMAAPSYVLEGHTSTGKSSLQELGAAHWGCPALGKGGLFVPAHGTENSFELPLERGSGCGAWFDEVSQISALAQRNLIFMNQSGVAKLRMNRNIEARQSRTWCTPLITSGEIGLTQRLQSEGRFADGGLTVRALPISTDNRPMPPPDIWAHVETMKANWGWSGPEFVEALIAQGFAAEPERLRRLVERYARQLNGVKGATSAQLLRAGRNVALLRLAANIARRAGLLPRAFDARGLADRLWTDARNSELAPADQGRLAMTRVIDTIVARKGGDIVPYADRGEAHREVLGYSDATVKLEGEKGKVVGAERVYVIRSDALGVLAAPATARVLRKTLLDAGILIPSPKGDSLTWSGFPGLGKAVSYVVLRAEGIESDEPMPVVPARSQPKLKVIDGGLAAAA